jgi:MinD superfamily P-loop ATPase
MIISVASGKGGTGKTTVAVNLALSLSNVQFLDCDAEEPNAHLFLKPKIVKSAEVCARVPSIDKGRCNFCGKCQELCAYNAIAVLKDDILLFPQLCHSCGGCMLICPKSAIREIDRPLGVIEIGTSGDIQFIHGRINIGEALSPPVIKAVKEYINPTRDVVIDVPPGTSCPVIEAVRGSDYCILVTEPTPFGLNDLTLAVETLRKLKIAFGVVINRAGMGNTSVADFCLENKIDILMEIPFDIKIARA